MDSQCRNSKNRSLHLNKLLDIVPLPILQHRSTSNAKIPIKPSMPDSTTICLYSHLHEARPSFLAHGLDAKTARIRVSTDHSDWISRLPFLANGKCHDGGAISCQVVFSAREKSGGP